jgi:hypothetical protein
VTPKIQTTEKGYLNGNFQIALLDWNMVGDPPFILQNPNFRNPNGIAFFLHNH